MISLRSRLLLVIFLVLLISSMFVSLLTFLTAQEELSELLDENMQQVAIAIAMQGADYKNHHPAIRQVLSEQGDFLIQVWDSTGKLQYTSHQETDVPLQNAKGFGIASFRGQDWRYYVHQIPDAKIQIVQPMSERSEDLFDFVGQFMSPILTQFPIALFLAYLLIGRGLRPLAAVSESIGKKHHYSLSPISLDAVPLEIRTLVNSLNELLLRLDVALRHQRQFTADAAHELNTPLAVIKLQLDVLERADTSDERQEAQVKLRAGVERGINLVGNLLTLASHEPGVGESFKAKTNLSETVHGIVEEVSPFAAAKNIQLHWEGGSGPVFVQGDAASLRMMIGNIVRNAIAYTQDNGKVVVSLRQQGGPVVLSVADNGIGISPENRQRVFNRFYRVLGTKQFGSGLGLAIAKSIADQHSLQISIHDGLRDAGTEFRIEFKKTEEV